MGRYPEAQVPVGVVATAVIVGAGPLTSRAVADARVESPRAPDSSPEARVEEFCRLDGDGGQLTEEGWRPIAPRFVTAGTRPDCRSPSSPQSTVIVGTPCAASRVTLSEDGRAATADIFSRALGALDLTLGRYKPVPGRMGVEGRGVLRLTNTLESGWRIDGPVLPPLLTVQTAIRELEALRTRTVDAEAKRNATQSLNVLRTLLRQKQ